MRDEELEARITKIVPISPELIIEGERVLAEEREFGRQLNALRERVMVLLGERTVLEAKRAANSDAFFHEAYKTHPELADVDCAYSTVHKAIVVYRDEAQDEDIQMLSGLLAAFVEQPPKEGLKLMGRVAKLDRPAQVHVAINSRLQTRIGLLLFSDAHGRVPYGAMSAFYEQALTKYVEELEAKLAKQWKETQNGE